MNFYLFQFLPSLAVSIWALTLIVSIPIGIASSVVGTKICAINTGIKKCKLIIEKQIKKNNEIAF